MTAARTIDTHKPSAESYPHTARLLGAVAGSFTAFAINLPFETATTRIQISNKKITTMIRSEVYKMIFNAEYTHFKQMPKHFMSLANGFTAGLGYKLFQGTFRYYTQPLIKDGFQKNQAIYQFYHQIFSEQFAKPMLDASAGSITGLLEVGLLPLDTIKKVCMASENQIKTVDIVKMLRSENIKLYRGAGWTAARNITGSFFQFGGYAFTMKIWFGLDDYGKATKTQIAISSLVGGVLMTGFTNPFDVLKVRRQTKKPADQVKGISYLFKGTTLKVATKSPIAALQLFFYHYYTRWFAKLLEPEKKPGLFSVSSSPDNDSQQKKMDTPTKTSRLG